MRTQIGDTNVLIPLHPNRNPDNNNEIPLRTSMSRKISKFSGNALYWSLQVLILLVSLSFNIMCNPVVWFLLKTIFNVLTEVFVYLVLGVCSVLISIITNIDEYYTKGQREKRMENSNRASTSSDYIKEWNVKKFVEKPNEF